MKTQIYFLVRLYCASLAEEAVNRVLSEIAMIASLDINLPISDEVGRSTVLRWVNTNYPDAYTEACKKPRHKGWIFDVATIEAELLSFQSNG